MKNLNSQTFGFAGIAQRLLAITLFSIGANGNAFEFYSSDSNGNVNQRTVGVYQSKEHNDNAAPMSSGQLVQQHRLDAFSKLDIRIPADIEYRGGRAASIELRGEQAVLEAIDFRVRGGRLMITSDDFRSNQRLILIISSQTLEDVILRGAQEASFSAIQSQHFTLAMRGSAEVTVSGQANRCEIEVQGAGDLDMQALSCHDLHLSSQGSADIQAHAKHSISGHVVGAGDLTVYGSPTDQRITGTGAFDIHYE